MTEEVKQGLEIIYSLADMMEKTCFHARMGFYNSPRKTLERDLLHFILYLIGGDTQVTSLEVDLLNEFFEVSNAPVKVTVRDVGEFIESHAETLYSNQVPESLKLFVSYDLNAKAEKKVAGFSGDVSAVLVKVFADLGSNVISCDGADNMEMKFLGAYLQNMVNYGRRELEQGGTAFTGGKK